MSIPGRSTAADGDNGAGESKDNAVARTAGFLVFSGIALSILKTLNPLNKNRNETKSPTSSSLPIPEALTLPPRQPIIISKEPITTTEQNVPQDFQKIVEITKGDTLWALSRKYGIKSSDNHATRPSPLDNHHTWDSILDEDLDTCIMVELWSPSSISLIPSWHVSIDAIKEANGLTGDTIYAGKKLIIPDLTYLY